MRIILIAEIATIIGSTSILLTLIFVVIELKKNVDQARTANIATRDQQYSQYTRYWLQTDNLALVVKGRKNYETLTEPAKLKFESYIEERIRMFSFSLSTSRLSSTPETHYNRVRAFLKYDGAIKCYEHLVSENVIPTVWQKAIQPALE
jgi:hypothetical protein